ncbi:PLP-dependent aminotransferase family protein [Actinoplanes sp. NPDC051851]|uniref:aminotransferase-like domain-containing protein n=1 Tax=Actinoplanes sp. NPDC051851 TaxID=3154753 RepID=UPI00344700B0
MSPITPVELAARLGRWSAGRGPLYLLLAGRLRALIDDGELPPGTGLPTDRALAAGLSAGRTTVVAAYDLLRQEGRLIRRQGSGTWVAGSDQPSKSDPPISPVFLNLLDPPDRVAQFACAGPTAAPVEVRTALRTAVDTMTGPDLGYHPAGHPRLRVALADRYTARGVPTTPDQILVTTGGQQALALVARALVAPGAEVLLQAPTYPGALEIFRESAAALRPVPAEAYASSLRRRPALAYLIPICHNPTGQTLPADDRRAIVAASRESGVPLLIDDVLADLSFPRTPAADLSAADLSAADLSGTGLSGTGREEPMAAYAPGADELITVGSLSKLIWAGLRVGWVRAQPPLIARLARLKAVHDLGSGVLEQLAAISLLADLDTLIATRVRILAAQHDHLCSELRRLLPSWTFTPAAGGQTLWVRLPHGDAASYAQTALRYGVAVLPGASLDPSGASTSFLRLPFVADPPTLTATLESLAAAWHTPPPPATPRPLPSIAV